MAALQPAIVHDAEHKNRYFVFLPLSKSATGPWAKVSLCNNVWTSATYASNRLVPGLPIGLITAGQPREGKLYTVQNGRLTEATGTWADFGDGFGGCSGFKARQTLSTGATLTCTVPAGHDRIAVRYVPQIGAPSGDDSVTLTLATDGAVASFHCYGGGQTRSRINDRVFDLAVPVTVAQTLTIGFSGGGARVFYPISVRSWKSTVAADPRAAAGDNLWQGNDLVELMISPWISGTLTAGGGTTAGTVTLASGHGITNTASIEIAWTGGSRYGIGAGTVTGTTVPFGATYPGFGDTLPANGTAVTIRWMGVPGGSLTGNNLHSPGTFRDCWRLNTPNTLDLQIKHLPEGASNAGFTAYGFHGVPHASSPYDWPLNLASAAAVLPQLYTNGTLIGNMTDDGVTIPYGTVYGANDLTKSITVRTVGSDGTAAEGGDKSLFEYVNSFSSDGIGLLCKVTWGGVASTGGADAVTAQYVYHPAVSGSKQDSGGLPILPAYMIVPYDQTHYALGSLNGLIYSQQFDLLVAASPYKLQLVCDGPTAQVYGATGNYKFYFQHNTSFFSTPATGVVWIFGGSLRIVRKTVAGGPVFVMP